MAQVKICGLRDAAGVDAALAGEARYLGFVVFPKSPRHIAPEAAGPLAERARGRADTVAVVVDASDELLAQITAAFRPDYIQAHGSESPARLQSIRRFARKGVIKAFSVARRDDLSALPAFDAVSDFTLLDAKAPAGAERPGGHGAAFDWTILKNARFTKPYFLSGGLNPENVAEAVAVSGASLVDVSSGVESAPGIKDPARIAAFLTAAQAAGPKL